MANETIFPISDLSGGVQRKTSKFLRKENEVELAINADFSTVGAVKKIKGYSQKGSNVPAGWVASDSTTTSTSTSTSTTSSSTSSSSTTTMA